MRPLLALWLMRHGLPFWLAPNYFILAGFAALVGCIVVMRLAREEGADLRAESRTLLLAYLGALLGGYVLEALRAIPHGLATRSLAPILGAGRAAYGGLLAATLCAALYRFYGRHPIAPFFDRVSVVLGLVYLAVRTGCFLAGCDYGEPTSLVLGVRYPPGSLAALDHAARGWVPMGAPSLPTHPTQLYEGVWAMLGSLIALLIYRRNSRRAKHDGSAFAAWIAMYAVGRFLIEFLRGDASRGSYHGLSTAQYISIGLGLLVGFSMLLHSRSERAVTPRLEAGGASS